MSFENRLIDKWPEQNIGHGFTAVPNLLISHRRYLRISVTDFYVLLAIEKYRWDNTQKPWPSIKTLAELTQLNERTIGRSTRNLEDAGLITKIHRAGTSNLYEMTPLVEELNDITIELAQMSKSDDRND